MIASILIGACLSLNGQVPPEPVQRAEALLERLEENRRAFPDFGRMVYRIRYGDAELERSEGLADQARLVFFERNALWELRVSEEILPALRLARGRPFAQRPLASSWALTDGNRSLIVRDPDPRMMMIEGPALAVEPGSEAFFDQVEASVIVWSGGDPARLDPAANLARAIKRRGGWSVADVQDVQGRDGRALVMVQLEGPDRTRRFWLDPARGGQAVRIRDDRIVSGLGEHIRDLTFRDFRTVGDDGAWMAFAMSASWGLPNMSGLDAFRLHREVEIVETDFEEPLPWSAFQIAIEEPKTALLDLGVGDRIRFGPHRIWNLDAIAEGAGKPVSRPASFVQEAYEEAYETDGDDPEDEEPPFEIPWRYVADFALAALLLAVAVPWILHLRRSRSDH